MPVIDPPDLSAFGAAAESIHDDFAVLAGCTWDDAATKAATPRGCLMRTVVAPAERPEVDLELAGLITAVKALGVRITRYYRGHPRSESAAAAKPFLSGVRHACRFMRLVEGASGDPDKAVLSFSLPPNIGIAAQLVASGQAPLDRRREAMRAIYSVLTASEIADARQPKNTKVPNVVHRGITAALILGGLVDDAVGKEKRGRKRHAAILQLVRVDLRRMQESGQLPVWRQGKSKITVPR